VNGFKTLMEEPNIIKDTPADKAGKISAALMTSLYRDKRMINQMTVMNRDECVTSIFMHLFANTTNSAHYKPNFNVWEKFVVRVWTSDGCKKGKGDKVYYFNNFTDAMKEMKRQRKKATKGCKVRQCDEKGFYNIYPFGNVSINNASKVIPYDIAADWLDKHQRSLFEYRASKLRVENVSDSASFRLEKTDEMFQKCIKNKNPNGGGDDEIAVIPEQNVNITALLMTDQRKMMNYGLPLVVALTRKQGTGEVTIDGKDRALQVTHSKNDLKFLQEHEQKCSSKDKKEVLKVLDDYDSSDCDTESSDDDDDYDDYDDDDDKFDDDDDEHDVDDAGAEIDMTTLKRIGTDANIEFKDSTFSLQSSCMLKTALLRLGYACISKPGDGGDGGGGGGGDGFEDALPAEVAEEQFSDSEEKFSDGEFSGSEGEFSGSDGEFSDGEFSGSEGEFSGSDGEFDIVAEMCEQPEA
jgi:hypothetical protein